MAFKHLLLIFLLVALVCLITLGQLHNFHKTMETGMTAIWEDAPVLGEKALEFIKTANTRGSKLSVNGAPGHTRGHRGKNMFASIDNHFQKLQETRGTSLAANKSTHNSSSRSNTTKLPSLSRHASSIRIPRIPDATPAASPGTNQPNNNMQTNNSTTTGTSHRIPRRIIFTYMRNLLQTPIPRHLGDNVKRTVQFFSEAWGLADPSQLDVLFLTDGGCIQLLEQVEPRMVPVFKGEELGSYKADMCRLAALYVHGGYYFDVDLEPVNPIFPPNDVDFVTSKMPNGMFFQAIMASSPGHPVMKAGLESMIIDWYMVPSILRELGKPVDGPFDKQLYESKEYLAKRLAHVGGLGLNHDPKDTLMGPMTLRMAFDRNINATTPWFLLEEDNIKLKLYPEYIRKASTKQSWGCNYMVHDPVNKTAYFYSRCRGTWLCPREGGRPLDFLKH